MNTVRLAILDFNNGCFNWGVRCIYKVLNDWQLHNQEIIISIFDVRQKNEVPNTNFDIYICTGGPGSPLEDEDSLWTTLFFEWIKKVEIWNETQSTKKHVLFICHSFQLACRYYKFGKVCKRKSKAFGIFPCHINSALHQEEPLFKGVPEDFYIVDNREYQVIEDPNTSQPNQKIKVLALEKQRPHVPLPQAFMALRFNDFFIGTQFHPEATIESITYYLYDEKNKASIIDNHGFDKWQYMTSILHDEDKLMFTNKTLIPNFLDYAMAHKF
ncbi:MAG: homoserine O-succinyltransferase [Sediminibacterium sp.]|nr:homoserine O-succinyltransferase [Sediminibacterium sp.]